MMERYDEPSRDGREAVIPLGACFFVGAAAAEIWQRLGTGSLRQWEEAHGRGGVASTGRVRQRREENQKYSRRSKDGKNNGGV